jgi:hypothetical protein
MPREERPPKNGGKTLTVIHSIEGVQEGQKPPPTRIYLFTHGGRLVDSKVGGDGPVTFSVDSGQDYRVTVGPDLLKDLKAPANLPGALKDATALSQDWLHQLAPQTIDFKIHPPIWICWFPVCINVHGTVRKLLNPGGTPPQYAPLCAGTVQIFQVDLGCTLDRFTVVDLALLKAKLIEKISPMEAVVSQLPHGPGPV